MLIYGKMVWQLCLLFYYLFIYNQCKIQITLLLSDFFFSVYSTLELKKIFLIFLGNMHHLQIRCCIIWRLTNGKRYDVDFLVGFGEGEKEVGEAFYLTFKLFV